MPATKPGPIPPKPPAAPKPAPPSPPAPPAPPDLSKIPIIQSIQIQFHTNDDDLDDDTLLSVTFLHGTSIFATVQPTPARINFTGSLLGSDETTDFSDNQTSPWFPVPLLPGTSIEKGLIHQCSTEVRIDPQGNDTWRFNYVVSIEYSDKTTDEFHFDGHALSQKIRVNTFPLINPPKP